MMQLSRLLPVIFFLTLSPMTLSATTVGENTDSMDKTNQEIDIGKIDEKSLSKLSKEEQDWYKKFQDGLLFFDGWQQISNEILSGIAPEEKENAHFLLKTIGVKIGTEWCKDNSIRKIDTDQLRNWGKTLRKVREEDPKLLINTLKSIDTEVDTVLTTK